MALRNTSTSWGLPARALHWVNAVMIIFMIGFGVWMTGVTERSAAVRLPLYGIHAWVGIGVLTVVVARLLWRFVNVTPQPAVGGKVWQHRTATLVHWLLYLLVCTQCLLGWALVGTFPTDALKAMSGIEMLPMLVSTTDRSLHETLELVHYTMAMTILALVVLHVAAALRHHVFLKNNVLTRMWSGRQQVNQEDDYGKTVNQPGSP